MDFKSDSNLGQNSAQMWELSRILPLILEDITDTESPQWSCFISLLEIMGICFAQKITLSSVLNLRGIVKEHLSCWYAADCHVRYEAQLNWSSFS